MLSQGLFAKIKTNFKMEILATLNNATYFEFK